MQNRWSCHSNGHDIQVHNKWYGGVDVFYDGQRVAGGWGLGLDETYNCNVQEDGKRVEYQVAFTGSWFMLWVQVAVIRDHVTIYTHKQDS